MQVTLNASKTPCNVSLLYPRLSFGTSMYNLHVQTSDKLNGVGLYVMLETLLCCGAFWWHALGPLVPLEIRVIANQYSVWSPLSCEESFYPDKSDLNGLMNMKMYINIIICYHLCSHQISTQTNNDRRFWPKISIYPLQSSKHQMRKYVLEEWSSCLQYSSRDL